jgi:hypothetical protein
MESEGRKPDKTQVWEDSSLYPETSTKNSVPEFHLRTVYEMVSFLPLLSSVIRNLIWILLFKV